MKGKRIANSSDHSVPELAKGNFYYDEQQLVWYGMTPNGLRVRLLDAALDAEGVFNVPAFVAQYDPNHPGKVWAGEIIAGEWVAAE